MRPLPLPVLIAVLLILGSAPTRSFSQSMQPPQPSQLPPASNKAGRQGDETLINQQSKPTYQRLLSFSQEQLSTLQTAFWRLPDQIEPITHHRVIRQGQIVLIRPDEIFFDLGHTTGIRAGDWIRIKRTFQFKHPVTGQVLADWLPIGIAKVISVDQTMSKAAVDPSWMLDNVWPGDLVECVVASAPPQPQVLPKDSLSDEPAKAWLTAWRASIGKTLKARIGIWEEYSRSQSQSPYAVVAMKSLQELRALDARLASAAASPMQKHVDGLEHSAPRSISVHQPVDLVFYIADPDALAGAWLHYRTGGTRSYRKVPLQRQGELYLRGQIPADAVKGHSVDYFVEIATHGGEVGAAIGAADRPVKVAIESPPISQVFTTPHNRSRVSLSASYLDFGDLPADGSSDSFMLLEADFFYRLQGRLYGIRTGFGALSGQRSSKEAGLHYGYSEIELRASTNIALSSRLIVGVGSDIGIGVEGRMRLGSEQSTNLSFGYSNITNIGFLADMRMQWDAMPRAPLGLAVAVTDQPDEGDLGIRLTIDLGYQLRPWFQPTLRLSYQARSIYQHGFGAGLGMVLDW